MCKFVEIRTEILIDSHIAEGVRLQSPNKTIFCTNFAHNVSFPGNFRKFSEILFSQNGRFWCVDLWNRTEILIDCHIARGKTSKSKQNHILYQFCTQCKFSWKMEQSLQKPFYLDL